MSTGTLPGLRRVPVSWWQLTPKHKAATEYITQQRMLVIPLEPGEKRPAFKTGENHGTLATLEAGIVDGWWTHRDYNIGWPCTPNRLAVIDVDGPDGLELLNKLEAEHGFLPTTWMQTSGREDRPSTQYIYRWPANELVPTRAIGSQLEIRGHGAQIVVPPSTHPTGSEYHWLIPPSDRPEGPADLPLWVHGLITRPETTTTPSPRPAAPRTTTNAERRLQGLVEAVATANEGNRNSLLNHAAYTAARIPGLTDTQITDRLTAAAQTSGLDDKEIGATINSGLTAGHNDGPDPDHYESNPILLPSREAGGEQSEDAEDPTSEWEPVDLTPILTGDLTHLDPPPSVLHRSDSQALLYKGELNWISGEPETGKSWLAQLAAVQEINRGNHIIYIDLEDTPGRIIDRLSHLGLTTEAIRDQFHYIRPTIGANPADLTRLLELAARCTLAVIDGTTDLHLIHGYSPEDNQDAAQLVSQLLRPLANAGPAVLPLDHVTKNKETRGRYAIGAQHKLAAVRGAAYHLETITPMGRGVVGQVSLYITKDRPGHIRGVHTLRQNLQKHKAGDFYLDATTPDIELHVAAPHEAVDYADAKRRGEIIEFIESRYMNLRRGLTLNEIFDGVGGKREALFELVKTMADEGNLLSLPQGRHPVYAPVGRVFNDE